MSTGASAGLRVVLDTNVLVSAFTSSRPGISSQIWIMARDQRFRLLASPALITEAADVLRRKFSWDQERVSGRVKLLSKTAEMVVPKLALRVVPEDDDDNRILECAVAGRASLIVSSDHHLRKLDSYEGISIVTPIAFHRLFPQEFLRLPQK